MTQAQRNGKGKRPKGNGVDAEFMRIIEKNLRKHREILERLAKI